MKTISLILIFAIIIETFSLTGSGDVTWFSGTLGSCGKSLTGYYVAMNGLQYTKTLCGKCIKIHGTKASITGKILDKCSGCQKGAIDVSKSAFIKLFGSASIGRVKNIKWETVTC